MISITELTMTYGPQVLFENVSLQFNPGNRYGLVGANGSGKSTLLKILAGEVTQEGGSVAIGSGCKLASLRQNHYAYDDHRTLDVVLTGREELWKALSEKKTLLNKESLATAESNHLGELEATIATEGGYTAESDAGKLLEGLGLPADTHNNQMGTLSGGYKLRVLLAQVLFSEPDVLLLDEPTNHLDIFSIRWLEGFLAEYTGTLLLVSHDHEFLNGVCTSIVDVDYGTMRMYRGNYDKFVFAKKEQRELMEAQLRRQEERKAELDAFITRFKAKASKARQAQSKEKMVAKIEDEIKESQIKPSSRRYPSLRFNICRPSGIVPLKIEGLSKAFGDKQVLNDVSIEVERGDKVAIIGPNGIGKSTLLNIVTGHLKSDQGSFNWGYETHWSYFPQDHTQDVGGKSRLLEWLWEYNRGMTQGSVREMLARVLFSGDDIEKQTDHLSGGEAGRMLLARMMVQKNNVLIFDEPTNHLDMEAIDAMADAISAYDGTVLLVSHHRYFVSRIANRIIEIGPNYIHDFRGTYEDFQTRHDNDHLSRDVNLKKRADQIEGDRKIPTAKKADKPELSHAERKKRRNRLKKLKNSVDQADKKVKEYESRIAEIEFEMAKPDFYDTASPQQQKSLGQEKKQKEDDMLNAMAQWEKDGAELEKMEAEE